MQIKRIKCPKCNVVLDVKNKDDVPELRLTCPKCGTLLQVKFSHKEEPVEAPTFYAPSKQAVNNDETQLGGNYSARGPHAGNVNYETQLGGEFSNAGSSSASQRIAVLTFEGREYPLAEGRNIIGRRASTSNATVQIATNDLYMSKQHCIVNVTTQANGNKKAVLSNYLNKNATTINGHKIGNGDAIILQEGNSITMGDTTVVFNIRLNN